MELEDKNPIVAAALQADEVLQKMNNISVTYETADWFINYNKPSDTTALVITGADGIGVMFLILKGNRIDEFKKVINEYKNFNSGIDGCLGECIRWACASEYLIPDRCTLGGNRTRVTVSELSGKTKYIKVGWPEIQDYMNLSDYPDECIFDPDKNEWAVPESWDDRLKSNQDHASEIG